MNKKQIYLWASEALAQFIEGASDSFLITMGGSTAAQIGAGEASPVTLSRLGCAMLVGGGIYVASWLKKNRMPTSAEPQPGTAQTTGTPTASIPPAI